MTLPKRMKDIDVLVIPSGASRILVILGALYHLLTSESVSINVSQLNTYICVSNGSIIGFLLILGFIPSEIYLYNKHHPIFDTSSFYSPDLGRKMTPLALQRNLIILLRNRKIDENINFTDLHKITGKNLVVVATNVKDKKTEYLSYTTTPYMSCIDAVFLPPIIKSSELDKNLIVGTFSDPYPIEKALTYKGNILAIRISECFDMSGKLAMVGQELMLVLHSLISRSSTCATSRVMQLPLETKNVLKSTDDKIETTDEDMVSGFYQYGIFNTTFVTKSKGRKFVPNEGMVVPYSLRDRA